MGKITTDVLVIGTGPSGATVARFLAMAGWKVTMIDTGPQLRRRAGEHLLNCFRYQHEPNLSIDEMLANREVYSVASSGWDANPRAPQPAFDPPLERLNFQNPEQDPNRNMPNAAVMHAVGGMFNLWSGFAPDPRTSERTDLIEGSEWTATLAIARKLFNVNLHAFKDSAVRRAIQQELKGSRACAEAPVAASFRNKSDNAFFVDWTGVDTILGVGPDGALPKNVTIAEEHRAEKLVLKNGSVDHTLVQNLKTLETIEVHAHTVFVCGGAFLTPRLLWNSNIRPDALGRFLTEHPEATCNVLLSDAVIAHLKDDRANPARNDTIPIPRNDAPPKLQFSPPPGKRWIGHTNRTGRAMQYDLPHDVRLGVSLRWLGSVEPNPDNHIRFSDTVKDRFGMPQITIDYRMSQEDTAAAREMLGDLVTVAQMLGAFAPMSRPPFVAKPLLQQPGSSLHVMGTTRMGKDPAESVVDVDCRVHDVDNLYVAGPCVIPNATFSNPTLPACAIAIRSLWKGLGLSITDMRQDVGLPAARRRRRYGPRPPHPRARAD